MVAVVFSAVVFLLLNGILWYERPDPNVWLLGAILLGISWSTVFLRLISRSRI